MLRLLIIGAFLLLSACASASDRPFTLIKATEGWMRMQAPPDASASIIASSGESTKEMLADSKKYAVTWFTRKTDDYLIYFQVRDSAADCGDEAPEFYKEDDGKWVEDRLSRISLCKN